MRTAPSPIRFGLALLVVVMGLAVASTAFGAAVALTPQEAIERAIVERMGGNVAVLVSVLRTDVVSQPALEARLDPAARAGRPARFVLTAGGVRQGTAVATVEIEARHARAARAIERDETFAPAAVDVVHGTLPGVAFKRLPTAADVVGLTARRAIAPGEPLTAAVLDVPPVVRSGDEVTVTVALGRVEVRSVAIASGSGYEGDVIRVLSRGSRRPVRARITGAGAVEVLR
jgi:flagella basal body P-ring formation protein FlgA